MAKFRPGDRVILNLNSAHYASCPSCGERWIILGHAPICPECGTKGLLGGAVDVKDLKDGPKPD